MYSQNIRREELNLKQIKSYTKIDGALNPSVKDIEILKEIKDDLKVKENKTKEEEIILGLLTNFFERFNSFMKQWRPSNFFEYMDLVDSFNSRGKK